MNARTRPRFIDLLLDLLGRQDVIEWIGIIIFMAAALGYCYFSLSLMEGLHK